MSGGLIVIKRLKVGRESTAQQYLLIGMISLLAWSSAYGVENEARLEKIECRGNGVVIFDASFRVRENICWVSDPFLLNPSLNAASLEVTSPTGNEFVVIPLGNGKPSSMPKTVLVFEQYVGRRIKTDLSQWRTDFEREAERCGVRQFSIRLALGSAFFDSVKSPRRRREQFVRSDAVTVSLDEVFAKRKTPPHIENNDGVEKGDVALEVNLTTDTKEIVIGGTLRTQVLLRNKGSEFNGYNPFLQGKIPVPAFRELFVATEQEWIRLPAQIRSLPEASDILQIPKDAFWGFPLTFQIHEFTQVSNGFVRLQPGPIDVRLRLAESFVVQSNPDDSLPPSLVMRGFPGGSLFLLKLLEMS